MLLLGSWDSHARFSASVNSSAPEKPVLRHCLITRGWASRLSGLGIKKIDGFKVPIACASVPRLGVGSEFLRKIDARAIVVYFPPGHYSYWQAPTL